MKYFCKRILIFLIIGVPLGRATDTVDAPVPLPVMVVTTQHSRDPSIAIADPKAPAQPAPVHDGADVLKSIPGFSVIRKGGTDGDPVLRGMAGSRLGIIIDGELIFGGCGNRMDPPTAYVFPAAYDRITVIKGPQSVLHGPGNSAGAVLFERDIHPFTQNQIELNASTTAGSFGRFDSVVDMLAGVPLGQVRVIGTTTRADDYDDGDGRAVHSKYSRWSANATATWTPDDYTSVEFSTAKSDGEAAYADRTMDGAKFDRSNFAVRGKRRDVSPLISAVEAHAYYNYVDHVMDNHSLRPFTPSMMMPGKAVSNPDRLTTGGLVKFELIPLDSLKVIAGLDTQHNVHTIRTTANQTTSPFEAKSRFEDASFRQVGCFAEGQYMLDSGQRIIAGARLDQWRVTDQRSAVKISMMSTALNPTAGYTRESDLFSSFVRYEHELTSTLVTLFAGLGRAQRFPDYWEMIKNESLASVSAMGTRPETTLQFDTGAIYRQGPLEFSVSLFASGIDDFILVQNNHAKPAGMMGTRLAVITRNVDASTIGGEASLGWQIDEHWKLDTSLAYVRGENDTDSRPLAQMPPFEGRIALAYATGNWSVGGLLRAVASQDRIAVNQGNIVGQDIGRSAGFQMISINAGWRPHERLLVSTGIDNLTDKTYAEHISRSGSTVAGFVQTTRVNEPGRNLWLQVQFNY